MFRAHPNETPRTPAWAVFAWALFAVPSVVLASAQGADANPHAELCAELGRSEISRRQVELASMVRGGRVTPNWLADGNRFWFAEGTPERRVIYLVDPEANTQEPFFDTERLRRSLTPVLRHEPPYAGLPFDSFTEALEGSAARFVVEDRHFELRLDTYDVVEIPAPTAAEAARGKPHFVRRAAWDGLPDVMEIPSPDGRWFLREEQNNLWLRSTFDGRSERLTQDGEEGHAWRLEDHDAFAHATFSPKGTRLAALKIDNRQVPRVPLVHWLKPREEVEWHSFTKAGGPLPRLELFAIDVGRRKAVRIDTGEDSDHFLMILAWAPDASELFFARIERDFKKVTVMAANPETGAVRRILEETQPTFVKNISSNPAITELFTLLSDGEHFLWISERDGWDHLYLYRTDGTLVRRLTHGAWPVVRVVGADAPGGQVFFTAHGEQERPYDTHLYRVDLDGTGLRRLTEGEGQHRPLLSPSKKFFLDIHSSIEQPPRVVLRRADGESLRVLSEADISALHELCWRPPEPFSATAADGNTLLYGVLFKPWDFDPRKSYPVLDYIYGGPSNTWVPRTFLDDGSPRGVRARALAQLGFVVILVDGRGTPERGKAFQDVVYGQFGRHEIPDHVATLKELAGKRPYLDLERVGVFGSSWGGYMALRALLLAPEVYRVGVATGALVDLYDHGAVGLEGYLGLMADNPEAYAYGSNLRLAHRLEGKLLLAHSTGDRNVTFSAAMKMVEALVRADKPYDLLVFPGQGHLLEGVSQRYRLEAIKRYFVEHLRP